MHGKEFSASASQAVQQQQQQQQEKEKEEITDLDEQLRDAGLARRVARIGHNVERELGPDLLQVVRCRRLVQVRQRADVGCRP